MRERAGLVILGLALGACRQQAEQPVPRTCDLMLVGGTIHSLDEGEPSPEVVIIDGGRILAMGDRSILPAWVAGRTVDLAGRTVVPGLIDAHAHFLGLGRMADQLDLRDCASFADVVARVKARAATTPPGAFILGRGWNQELWPDEAMPLHGALSAVSPDHPVLLRRVDGHATLANAKAMAMAGLTATTPMPAGGEMLLDAKGAPTGVFLDAATDLLPSPPEASPADLERWALAAQERCLAVGLTGVHDAGVGERDLLALERLADDGRLWMRLNVMLAAEFDERDIPQPWLAARLAKGPVTLSHHDHLSVRAMKIYLDGALGSRGAALLQPYEDDPDSTGLMQLTREQLRARVAACRAAGFQAATHAIGDAANRMVLDVYEDVLGAQPAPDARWRIEHAQVIALDDIPRFAKAGVIASVEPTHATSDMNMAEERLGRERLRGAYAWASLRRAGARLALGSDFPVESENPWWGIYAAVTRMDHDGKPPGGWHAEEALTREQALRGFTLDAAWAGFDENELGSLSPGKRADFVVLPEDPLTCPADHLVTLRPLSTWVGGREAYIRETP